MKRRQWADEMYSKLASFVKAEENTESTMEQLLEEERSYSEEEAEQEEVFDTGMTPKQMEDAVSTLRKEARDLRAKVKVQLRRYREKMQKAEEMESIDKDDIWLDADAHLNEAKSLREEYDAVAAQFQTAKQTLSKYNRLKRREKRREELGVSFSEWGLEEMDQKFEEQMEQEQIEAQSAERVQSMLNMEGGRLKPDLSDIKKDEAELERDRLENAKNGTWSKVRDQQRRDIGQVEDAEKEEKREEEMFEY